MGAEPRPSKERRRGRSSAGLLQDSGAVSKKGMLDGSPAAGVRCAGAGSWNTGQVPVTARGPASAPACTPSTPGRPEVTGSVYLACTLVHSMGRQPGEPREKQRTVDGRRARAPSLPHLAATCTCLHVHLHPLVYKASSTLGVTVATPFSTATCSTRLISAVPVQACRYTTRCQRLGGTRRLGLRQDMPHFGLTVPHLLPSSTRPSFQQFPQAQSKAVAAVTAAAAAAAAEST